MELHKVLFEMEDPMNRLRDGICALWDYLDQMYDRLHTQFYACIELCQAEHKGSAPAQD